MSMSIAIGIELWDLDLQVKRWMKTYPWCEDNHWRQNVWVWDSFWRQPSPSHPSGLDIRPPVVPTTCVIYLYIAVTKNYVSDYKQMFTYAQVIGAQSIHKSNDPCIRNLVNKKYLHKTQITLSSSYPFPLSIQFAWASCLSPGQFNDNRRAARIVKSW